MDLQGKLGFSGFLEIEKAHDGGSAHGCFHPPPLCFMPLINPDSPLVSTRALFQLPSSADVALAANDALPGLFQDAAFGWFLQWFYPTLTVTRPFTAQAHLAIVLKDATHATLLQLNQQEAGWAGQQRGTFPLWLEVQRAYACFVQQQPTPERYAVYLDSQAARLVLTGKDPLVLCNLYNFCP